MKTNSIDHLVFAGIVLLLIYQNALLYLSVIGGSWQNFVIVAGTFVLGLLLGRTTYLILGSILAFVSMSSGLLILILPTTREPYLWPGIALLTVTPLTAYLMYLMDHRLLKRKALGERLALMESEEPNREVITGALNNRALARAVQRELEMIRLNRQRYRFTLTMVKIDFLESIVNFLGHDEFNTLLRVTAQHLQGVLYRTDQLYYIGAGKFVIMSPMLGDDNAPDLRHKVKAHIDDIAEGFGLTRHALVLRTGQLSSQQPTIAKETVAGILARLERNAETDIVKEYI